MALLPGCGGSCQTDGCPTGKSCSLRTGLCLDASLVYGPPCATSQDCERGVCLQTGDTANPSVCTGLCGSGEPGCPVNFSCASVSDGQGGSAQVCVPTGGGPLGATCQGNGDCQSGLCLPVGQASFCSQSCDPSAPGDCGTGNFACEAFQDSQGTQYHFCVKGGSALPGDPCPNGITDCDLTKSAACLQDSTGSTSLCAPACPGGQADCTRALAGSCCQDLGTASSPQPYCLPGQYCSCQPDCVGRACGDDGCGGSCGSCGAGKACSAGACVACAPDCTGKTCGDDGCGGTCGTCPSGQICQAGACSATCTPDCTGKACGDDGCGGLCGTCPQGTKCGGGQCVAPAALLFGIQVDDPAMSPAPLWALDRHGERAVHRRPGDLRPGPPARDRPDRALRQSILCSAVASLVAETPYRLRLTYDAGNATGACTATFTLHDGAAATVDGGDCVTSGGGPFQAVTVEGGPGSPAFAWTLP